VKRKDERDVRISMESLLTACSKMCHAAYMRDVIERDERDERERCEREISQALTN